MKCSVKSWHNETGWYLAITSLYLSLDCLTNNDDVISTFFSNGKSSDVDQSQVDNLGVRRPNLAQRVLKSHLMLIFLPGKTHITIFDVW